MTGFARRPLAVFVYCLFAGMQASHAVDTTHLPLPRDEAGDFSAADASTVVQQPVANDADLRLRRERKFNVLGRNKRPLVPRVGIEYPVELNKGDSYPTFLIADIIEGRTDVLAEAEGNVELRKLGSQLYADKLTYWPLEDEVDAVGNVRLLQEGTEVKTPHLRMQLSEQIGFAERPEYHILKEVESKFYQTKRTVVTVASSNAASTGAPMMLNVPNSYGLPTISPPSRPSEASGHAERADFEGENQITLTDATYSTCKPGQTDWYLQASEMHLDYDRNVGDASHASLWFKGVPIFYSPLASFPLNNKRRSGVLHPSLSTSTVNGFEVTLPYYWNIAPNYDATFYPRYMAKRGFQFGAEARYLDSNYRGTTRLEYMPNDEIEKRHRYAYKIEHQHNFGRGLSAVVNWQEVSDDNYWEDMSSRLLQTSQTQLPQQLVLGYSPFSWLQTNTQVLRYQTLQPDPATPISRPYFLEPQINVVGYKPNVLKTDVSLLGQYSRFTHPDKVAGDRFVLYPQVSIPLVHPAFQITPKFGVHMTKYALDQQIGSESTSISRTLPTFSLDSTVIFERESSWLDTTYIQTLEPRLYYVNIPYKDQSRIPIFDSGLSDFNFAQIFAENRYSGFDRINDANQLTAALTTRLLDANTGVERFKAMIGQRYYFQPQRVTITGETERTEDFSNLVAAVNGLVLPKTYADAALEYNYRDGASERFSIGARFQPDFGKVLSASYRYTRDPLTNTGLVDQIDIAGQWPISAKWYAVGRYNYSLRDAQLLEAIGGLEYNAGCWAARVVAQRLEAVAGTPNTSFFFQLELSDFGSIGSDPLSLLRRSIPGYGKTNELPDSGSRLTTQ
jgi:LPS-assembly protein